MEEVDEIQAVEGVVGLEEQEQERARARVQGEEEQVF